MVNCFAGAFAGVYSIQEPANPAPHQTCDSVLDDIIFTVEDVYDCLSRLDEHSSVGPDGYTVQ